MMNSRQIPDRQRIGDVFSGVVLQVNNITLLADTPPDKSTDDDTGDADATVLHEGEFIVRYGVRYLGKPHLSIVPGLLATDTGEIMTGENAWDFLLNRSNLFPRADVQGYRNDGEDDMVFVKELDLMQPIQLLVYNTAEATKPLAQVAAVISQQPDNLPERLHKHADVYPSITEWRNQHDT
jgi:hypothetical protein